MNQLAQPAAVRRGSALLSTRVQAIGMPARYRDIIETCGVISVALPPVPGDGVMPAATALAQNHLPASRWYPVEAVLSRGTGVLGYKCMPGLSRRDGCMFHLAQDEVSA